MNNQIAISGEVGWRNDGGLDIQTIVHGQERKLCSLVWNIAFTDDFHYLISLTDADQLALKNGDRENLATIRSNDSIETRVEIAQILREWTNLTEDIIDCFKDLIMNAWIKPSDAQLVLTMQRIMHDFKKIDTDKLFGDDEQWD